MLETICSPGQYRRFWAGIEVRAADECWPSRRRPMEKGYVRKDWCGQRLVPAHVIAYTLTRGPVPSGYVLHHECENKVCCNPAHLRVMSQREHARLHLTKDRCPTCGGPYTAWVSKHGQLRRRCRACSIIRMRVRRKGMS